MDEKDERLNIGQRIRKARLTKGMTQAELAEAAHIATSNVSDIELGKSRMWLSTFCRIVEALQVCDHPFFSIFLMLMNQKLLDNKSQMLYNEHINKFVLVRLCVRVITPR